MFKLSKKNFILSLLLVLSGLNNISFAEEVKVDRDCEHWAWQGPHEVKKWNGDREIFIYKGECSEGLANGKGTLFSYNTALSVYAKSKTKIPPINKYQGYFRQGVYLGEVNYKGLFLFNKYRVATQLGESNNHPVWLLTSQPEGWGIALPLCKPKAINIGVKNYSNFSDNALSKAEFKKAFKLYSKLCPKTDYDVILAIVKDNEVYNHERTDKNIVAEMNNTKKNIFVFYRNGESNRLASQNEQEKLAAKKQHDISRIHDNLISAFKKANVAKLITMAELSKNPFLWEGKNIAVSVKLEEMISRDTALLSGTENTYSKGSYAINVQPDIFKDGSIILMAKVKGKSKIQGKSLATVSYISHYVCEKKDCFDIDFSGIKNYPQ